MKRWLAIIALILGSAGLVFGAERLVLQGSTTVLPIAERAAEEFMKRNPGVEVSVRGGGSGVGIAGLMDGTCDIANSSRSMKEKEWEEARQRGIDPKEFVIAMDAIAVIVHPSNPVEDLTLDQLRGIYTGLITNWKEIGGPDMKIVVVSRDSASGTYEAFNHLVLGNERLTPRALYEASNKAVVLTVAKTKGAIGYVGLAYVEPTVKAIKVNGVEPSEETVKKGLYSLQRPLFMYTKGEPQGLVRAFIQFVLSEEGQKIVKEVGYIPVR